MSRCIKVTVRIDSFWRVGTGRGAAGRLDALCIRDGNDLPFLPGRSLKGLLRDAVDRAEQWGWFEEQGYPGDGPPNAGPLTVCLFGEPGFRIDTDGAVNVTEPVLRPASGCLQVANAILPQDDRAWLCQKRYLVPQLFCTMNSTAINPNTGAPLHGALRAEEVVVPLTLEAGIAANDRDPPDNWPHLLRLAAPLIRAVGSGKSRGLGRCHVIIEGDSA
jgi:hypothetical protein